MVEVFENTAQELVSKHFPEKKVTIVEGELSYFTEKLLKENEKVKETEFMPKKTELEKSENAKDRRRERREKRETRRAAREQALKEKREEKGRERRREIEAERNEEEQRPEKY